MAEPSKKDIERLHCFFFEFVIWQNRLNILTKLKLLPKPRKKEELPYHLELMALNNAVTCQQLHALWDAVMRYVPKREPNPFSVKDESYEDLLRAGMKSLKIDKPDDLVRCASRVTEAVTKLTGGLGIVQISGGHLTLFFKQGSYGLGYYQVSLPAYYPVNYYHSFIPAEVIENKSQLEDHFRRMVSDPGSYLVQILARHPMREIWLAKNN